MADMKSYGLMKPGHFTSSKRAMDLHEPIYLNLFTVSIDPADLPAGLGMNEESTNLILEGVRSVSGLDTQPGVGSVQQKYKFSERGYAGGQPSKTHIDLTLNFELNLRTDGEYDDNYTYKFLRGWSDLIYDPLTGRMTTKKNYICRQMTITMQDKDGRPFHQWQCYNLFPTSAVPNPQLSYDNGSIWQGFSMTFWCDYFDEAIS